jgi:hypothetical protein
MGTIIVTFGNASRFVFGGCLLGFPLKSAYVNGIRKISELRRGQVVRLAGSGAAVVEEVWNVGECYFGRFRCQDGLVVLLTEAEESMIGTLTRLRAVQST